MPMIDPPRRARNAQKTTMRFDAGFLDRLTAEAELIGVSRTRLVVIMGQAYFDMLDAERGMQKAARS